MIQVIVGAALLLFWYIGFRMAKAEGDMVIRYREEDIKRLTDTINHYEQLLETSFNRKDMKEAYVEGSRCNRPGHSFGQWMKKRFGETISEPVKQESV